MEIFTTGPVTDPILVLVPKTDKESCALTAFTRTDEPLTAVLKKNRDYLFPQLEIKKE